MDELLKKLPELVREETMPEIPKKIHWRARFFGKSQLWEYIRNYYEEESAHRVPFYLPYIYLKEIFRYLCRTAGISKKQVSMVVIDGGDSRTDYFLYEFLEKLNFLTIITERQAYFEGLQERAFQELGLLIDLALPWEEKNLQGNLVWDFTDNLQKSDCYPTDSICFVPHKKEWKIAEILRECPTVTAVSIKEVEIGQLSFCPSQAESFLVPAGFPFRKSRCEELKRWCGQRYWSVKLNVRRPEKP